MIKEYFWVAVIGVLLNATLIIVNAAGFLPLNLPIFAITFFAIFLLALYRPIWVFWLFVISLPLESVIISSSQVPISFRPFQVIGLMLFVATVTLIVFRIKKENFPNIDDFKKINFFDCTILFLCLLSFISLFNSLNFAVTLKQNFVLLSFVMIYFLSKFYFQNKQNKLEALWFFVATSLPVLIFGIYQSLAFKLGWIDFQVFAERANGTFTEPDWFGIYLVFLSAIIYWLKLQLFKTKNTTMISTVELKKVGQWAANLYLFLIFIVLLLTVARSAWLGFLAVTLVYFCLLIIQKRFLKLNKFNFKSYIKELFSLGLVYALGILSVVLFGLSNFNLGDRAASSVSGLQEITISCQKNSEVPNQIPGVELLGEYGCRHINLEEIDFELALGNEIKKVYRPDPNIEIRKNIYLTTLDEIKNNFWIGRGLGSSSEILGMDSYGHGLNTSNIFLEVWFSWGVFGLVSFLILLILPLKKSAEGTCLQVGKVSNNSMEFSFGIFVILTMIALIIPNLFNAGIFLSLFWVWLAIINS